MKYITKKCYEDMQNITLRFGLVLNEKVDKFSEEYFQEVYKKEKEKFKEGCSFATDEYCDAAFQSRIDNFKRRLPSIILNEIKDIRFLAFGHVTRKVYDDISKFSLECQRSVDKAFSDYDKEFKKQFSLEKPKFVLEDFHDSDILSLEKSSNDYVLILDNSGAFTNVKKIVFKDATIIEKDWDNQKLGWLYDEIYKIKNGYEVHLLLGDDNDEYYLTVKCADINLY